MTFFLFLVISTYLDGAAFAAIPQLAFCVWQDTVVKVSGTMALEAEFCPLARAVKSLTVTPIVLWPIS